MTAAGDKIGPYAIVSELGRGGMATLYLARRTAKAGFVRDVAIKVVHEHLRDSAELVEMFLDEARVSSRVRHPNVVHVEDLGEHEGQPYLVMEYVDGVTLADLLRGLVSRDEQLPIPIAVALIAQVADGLHAAHEAIDEKGRALGIVHRDVSPQNVLISSRGVVKLIDFGIARSKGRAVNTDDGGLKGKLAYMSPEQVGGRPLDRRTDLYALGIVLWETLVLKRLFYRETDYKTFQAVVEPDVRPPSELRSDVPESVSDIAMRALRPTPEDRQQTAQQLRRELLVACPGSMLVDAKTIAGLVTGAAREVLTRRRSLAGEFGDRTSVTHPDHVELSDNARLVNAEDISESAEEMDSLAVDALVRGDLVTATMCKSRVVLLLSYAGELKRAQRAQDEAEEMTADAAPALRGYVEASRARLLAYRGDYLGRLRSFVRARELLEHGGWIRRALSAAGNVADAYNHFGAYAAAEEASLDVLGRARQLEIPVTATYAQMNAARSRMMLGRLVEAEAGLAEALQLALQQDLRHAEMFIRMYRADLLAQSGRMLQSLSEADLALELATKAESASARALASIRVAHAALALGDAAAALDAAARAHELWTQLGGLEESEADLFLVYHRALEAMGDRQRAKEILEEGRNRLLESAEKIDDEEWKRRFLEDVPANKRLLAL